MGTDAQGRKVMAVFGNFAGRYARLRRQWLSGTRLCAVVVALVCGAALRAHEIGTTRVSVFFQDGRTYEVEISTDATALVEKLETSAGRSPTVDAGPGRLQSLLTSFDTKFRQRVKTTFDATNVRPAIAYSVAPGMDALSGPVATIRLTGPIPPGARHFTWTYGWTFAPYTLTMRNAASEVPRTESLEGDQSSAPFTFTPSADRVAIAWRFLTLGFAHIVPNGLHHVLLVLGLYLLSGCARFVLWQVSAFTIAHSISMALSLYGVFALSPRIVEPSIALSTAYIALENVWFSGRKSLWRVALVFAIGLLHGLGLTEALREFELPHSELVTALLAFNVGIEAGQLAVIGAAVMLVGGHSSSRVWYRSRIVVPVSTLIACTAVYWTIERL